MLQASSVAAVRPWTQSPTRDESAMPLDDALSSEAAPSRSASRGPKAQHSSATPVPHDVVTDAHPIPKLKDETSAGEGRTVTPVKLTISDRAAALRRKTAGMRLELAELKDSIAGILRDGFATQVALVTEKVARLQPKFATATVTQTSHTLSAVRHQTNSLSSAVRAFRNDLTISFTQASAQLQTMAQKLSQPSTHNKVDGVSLKEREAIHELHTSIEAVITSSGLGPHLSHDHQRWVNDVSRQVRNEDNSPVSEKGNRSPRLVDETTMPQPDDVNAGMFGPRPWNRHAPSLLEAVPYAVAALRAIAFAIQANYTSREMLHLRISRQEKLLEDATSGLQKLQATVQDHITTTYKAVARVANGLVLGQYVPASSIDDSDVSAKLAALTNVVERFIEHLAWAAQRQAAAQGRRSVLDGDISSAGADSKARDTLFPPVAKAGEVAGQLALLRHRYYALKLRTAVQTWRFRRCALALVANHTTASAKQATEDAAMALSTAAAEFARAAAEATGESTGAPTPQAVPLVIEPVLPFWKAHKRMQESGLLPKVGADHLDKPAAKDDQPLDVSFMKRSQDAIQSWRARKAKEALLKFKEQQQQRSQAPQELPRTLMTMEGGMDTAPTVFSALPATPANPRYQRPTHVSATKQRLRPISQPGTARYQALTPRPPTSLRGPVADASVKDVLDVFLRGV